MRLLLLLCLASVAARAEEATVLGSSNATMVRKYKVLYDETPEYYDGGSITVGLIDSQGCGTESCFTKILKSVIGIDESVENVELLHDPRLHLMGLREAAVREPATTTATDGMGLNSSPLLSWIWDLSDSQREDIHSWLYTRYKNISATVNIRSLMGTDALLSSRAICGRMKRMGFDSINIMIDEFSLGDDMSRSVFNWILLFIANCNIYVSDIRLTLPPKFLSNNNLFGTLFLPIFQSLHPHISKVFLKYYDQDESRYMTYKDIFLRPDTGWDAIVNRCYPWYSGTDKFVIQKSLTATVGVMDDKKLHDALCEAHRVLGYSKDLSLIGLGEGTKSRFYSYVKSVAQPCSLGAP